MRRLVPGFTVAITLMVLGAPSSRLSATSTGFQPAATYRVAVALDPSTRLLSGSGRILWRNASSKPVSDLRFLTAWNGRRHDRTTWSRERRGQGRPVALGGWLDVAKLSAVTATGAVDLLPRVRSVAPDDGNAEDTTVWSVVLDAPVAPAQTVDLDIAWTARVPDLADGLGAYGSFFLVADWLPRLALLDDRGWHAHQSHAGLRASAPYDRFDVSVRLPSAWVVGAGVAETGRQERDGWTTRRFETTANALAWAADTRFVERVEEVTGASSRPVKIRVLAQREHASSFDRYVSAAKATLTSHRRWLRLESFADTLTIVDVPESEWWARDDPDDGLVAAYPGLVAVHTPWVTPWTGWDPERGVVEGVSAQYWSATLAPIADEDAWMNAGLSRFLADRVLREAFPGRFVQVDRYFDGLVAWPYAGVRPTGRRSLRRGVGPDLPPPAEPAWQQDIAARDVNLRQRTPAAFEAFARLFGWDSLARALGDYDARNASSHPDPAELMTLVNSATNRDVSWFFDRTIRSAARFDYAVGPVTSVTADDGSISTVVIRRLERGSLPVEVRVMFADGSSIVDRWDGADDSRTFEYHRASPVASVEIDPDHTLAVEANRLNNSWTTRRAASGAAAKWAARWAAWFQHVLLTYAALV